MPQTPPHFLTEKQSFYVLVHHVLNALPYLAERGGFTAVVKHCYHRLHAPEHLSQHLVLVRQRQTGGQRLGKAVVALVRWHFSARRKEEDGYLSQASQSLKDDVQTFMLHGSRPQANPVSTSSTSYAVPFS